MFANLQKPLLQLWAHSTQNTQCSVGNIHQIWPKNQQVKILLIYPTMIMNAQEFENN